MPAATPRRRVTQKSHELTADSTPHARGRQLLNGKSPGHVGEFSRLAGALVIRAASRCSAPMSSPSSSSMRRSSTATTVGDDAGSSSRQVKSTRSQAPFSVRPTVGLRNGSTPAKSCKHAGIVMPPYEGDLAYAICRTPGWAINLSLDGLHSPSRIGEATLADLHSHTPPQVRERAGIS